MVRSATPVEISRKRPSGWVPEQKLTLAEAIFAYTAGAAYAEFQDKDKGRLAPGQLADLVILAEDVFEVPAERIREDFKVETTIAGGRVVYQRSP